jgi:tetratricopeptide (TPR) repeat protein
MRRFRLFALPLLVCVGLAFAGNKPESWLQVSSQHFTILTNGSDKDARHIADQFERMRAIFHAGFPDMQLDPAVPIVVIAVKDAKDFRELEPEAYLSKGQLNLAGLFLRAPDKNYVLLRMDAGGEHPYATVYHEYTHLLFAKTEEWMPLWLNEGLAQFYENTDVYGKDTVLGQANAYDILFLRQNQLIPLSTLFTVERNSPYYHEENKGSIFYAESWALTHYLQVTDFENRTHRVPDYALLVANHVDPVTAATRAFGDLTHLQSQLNSYVQGANYKAFRLKQPPGLYETTYKTQPVTVAQANAVRADFLAYNQREKDARALLDQVFKDDPNNTLAHETMGQMEFRAGHLEQAQNWYEQAVKLDSQSYLANYYFAAIAMNRGASEEMGSQIESSLQKAIKLNPSFAPSYDRLAMFYNLSRKNLDQAHILELQAVQHDPGNVAFRVNTAYILVNMQRENDAVTVLQTALKMAKNPGETASVQNALEMAKQVEYLRTPSSHAGSGSESVDVPVKSTEIKDTAPTLRHREEVVLNGPHRNVTGTIKNVHCSSPSTMDLDVEAGQRIITMHTANYYNLQFTALGFTPQSELKPCTDLEGSHARVEYIEGGEAKINGVVAIELHR